MGKFYQFQAAVAGSFGSLVMGLLNVWPSYTLSLYKSENTTVLSAPMTDMESSLVGSLPSLGAMVGTAVAGLLMDMFGRKMGGVAIALPFVLSWAIIEVCSTSLLILIARFLGGISGGAFLVYGPVFISEIAEESIRGMLASGPVMFYCLGVMFSYLMGWFCTYRTIIWINIITSVLCVILVLLIVESPIYLLKQNREEDARQAIAHYRGTSPSSKVVLEVLSRLKQQITPVVELIPVKNDTKVEEAEKEKLNPNENNTEEQPYMSSLKKLFVSPSSRRGFILVIVVITMQVMMGMVPVQVYAKTLFAEAAPNLSSHLCSVLFALVLLGGCMVTAVIADKAGRRVLLMSSSMLVGICMASMGYLLQSKVAPPWVTALIILMYCFSFNFGAGTIPYVLLAEAFVPEVQNIASMLIIEWVWFLNFFVIAVFPILSKLLGIYGVFYIFACVGVANAIISYIIVPETKGLSNEQIQEALLRRKNT